jgi:hypothetical protein
LFVCLLCLVCLLFVCLVVLLRRCDGCVLCIGIWCYSVSGFWFLCRSSAWCY